MSEKWSRQEYFEEMGICDFTNNGQGNDTPYVPEKAKGYNKCKHKNALKRAHEIRQFEINLYWERSKYMYVMVGAVSAGLYNLDNSEVYVNILVSLVGVLLSGAWVLINKGSRFWQENWEAHIDYLEDEFEGELYKTVNESKLSTDGFSVSKVNTQLSWFSFFGFLGMLFFYVQSQFCNVWLERIRETFFDMYLLVVILVVFLSWVFTVLLDDLRTSPQKKHDVGKFFSKRELKSTENTNSYERRFMSSNVKCLVISLVINLILYFLLCSPVINDTFSINLV